MTQSPVPEELRDDVAATDWSGAEMDMLRARNVALAACVRNAENGRLASKRGFESRIRILETALEMAGIPIPDQDAFECGNDET
jgi:hypothetical protein